MHDNKGVKRGREVGRYRCHVLCVNISTVLVPLPLCRHSHQQEKQALTGTDAEQ